MFYEHIHHYKYLHNVRYYFGSQGKIMFKRQKQAKYCTKQLTNIICQVWYYNSLIGDLRRMG